MDRTDKRRLSSRRAGWIASVALALGLLAGCSSLAGALLKPKVDTAAVTLDGGDFVLDPHHAALLFKIDHLGFSNYAGRFDRFDATLSGDPANPAGAQVEATIDMTSLDIANPEFAAELMGPAWFDAGTHPQAIFRSRTIRLASPTEAEIDGDLTLKGITRPITLIARLNGSAYDPLRGSDVVGFSVTGSLSRSDFGVDKFSGLLTDTVNVEVEAEFIRRKPD
ncbi:YceI family protein [Hyphomonas sp. WL0036]|uniref:YceI family protein n=1 Tax=Hyphomonas sediminis TaxID=2866160 RepID=UPI001C823483|nr:YceI family protein [Hyphomonas sediminis]MBY9065518.1 YceI family protein [Hyphomonas sediminis]